MFHIPDYFSINFMLSNDLGTAAPLPQNTNTHTQKKKKKMKVEHTFFLSICHKKYFPNTALGKTLKQ